MVERRRPQRRRQPANRLGRDVDVADHRLHAVDHLRREPERQEIADRPGQVDLQAGQGLPELVVQFPRQMRPLGFAGRMQAGREPPQLAFGLAQTVLNLQARGDVPADAFDGDQPAAAIENRDAAMIGPDDPAVRMDPPQLDRELQFPRIVLKRFRDQRAIVRMDAGENQIRVGVKLLPGASRDAPGRRS